MKYQSIALFLISACLTHAGAPVAPATGTVSFEFDASTINGNGSLGTAFKNAVDGETTATLFDLSSVIAGLTLTITPSQSDISNTANGLGITSGGTLNTAGDALTFSFNKAITFDFLDMGDFTGEGLAGEDSVSLSYSNANPTISLVGGDFDNDTSDTITFTTGNALIANESFTISRVDGDFAIEGFNITVVPESSAYAMLTGLCALSLIIIRRRHTRL
ncbi:MAG TPA: hypothetical protein DCX06_04460 [Opitutae bacterium]|nr:hypothetical protein [Opitutae bacterium]